jgi:membrane protein implicated in regulation of membrane protease activity
MEPDTLALVFVVIGVALAAFEIVAPGLILLPFALGAGFAAVAGFLGAPVPVQLAVFLVASFVSYLALRPMARRLGQGAPTEGIGANRLLGVHGVVLEEIAAGDGETGLVRIDREEWRAETESAGGLPVGTPVQVTDVRGTRVVVAARDTAQNPPAAEQDIS